MPLQKIVFMRHFLQKLKGNQDIMYRNMVEKGKKFLNLKHLDLILKMKPARTSLYHINNIKTFEVGLQESDCLKFSDFEHGRFTVFQ